MQDIDDFLIENKVKFETLIRCANYWNSLTQNERIALIELYEEGALNEYGGWY